MACFTALATVSISYGLGVHAVDLNLDQTVGAVKFLVFGQFVVSLSMGTSKVAVGLFLLRIIQEMWYALSSLNIISRPKLGAPFTA